MRRGGEVLRHERLVSCAKIAIIYGKASPTTIVALGEGKAYKFIRSKPRRMIVCLSYPFGGL